MFIKSDIRKVSIALEKELARKAYIRIGKAGIIHLAHLEAVGHLADESLPARESATKEMMAGIGFILKTLSIEPGEDANGESTGDARADALWISQLKRTMERWLTLRKRIEEKISAVSGQLEYAQALSEMGIDPRVFRQARFSKMVFGQRTEAITEDLANEPFVLTVSGHFVFGVALPRHAPQMLAFLKDHGFVDETAVISGDSLEPLKKRQEVLQNRLAAMDQYAGRLRLNQGRKIAALYRSYEGAEEVLQAMHFAQSSRKVQFISGWMDIRDQRALVAILKELCGNRFILTFERDPNAPVRLRNMRLFKPFELIVKTMGIPAQSEMDPTPLAALTFVLVFGLMFGDLGQGLALAASGVILKFIAGKRNREDLGQAGGILMACGLSAAFCGVLYGSCFSSEHLIPALWIRPAENIMRLFSVTILIGAAVIVVGLCLNIINAFVNADYPEALLEKKGLAVLILYVSAVYLAARYLKEGRPAALWEVGLFIILPLLIFALRGVLAPLLFHAKKPHDVAEYITETVMDIVEIALSLFANTVSFIRVGAFALSHAGLSIVTYTLAGMVDPALKSAGALACIVIGNIFILGFEGLICGIQSMRLEYYEFFSKFYRGDGVEFSPFKLKAKVSEV